MRTFREAVAECRRRIAPCGTCGVPPTYQGGRYNVALSVPFGTRIYCEVIVFLSRPDDAHAFASLGQLIEVGPAGSMGCSWNSLPADDLRKLALVKEAVVSWQGGDGAALEALGAVDFEPRKLDNAPLVW